MRILVTGSNGLLGQKIVGQLLKKEVKFLATSQGDNRNSSCESNCYESLDITDFNAVELVVKKYRPTHIIHTAALTNVDHCEVDPEKCYAINVTGTDNLFSVCKALNIHFQLVSTDFVFDGLKGNYSEEDDVNPLSIYAKSKVEAEQVLKASTYKNWAISRTIIVYGTGENLSRSNLLVWAKTALPNGDKMRVIDDQFRSPTWADDLAWGCIRICELDVKGVFHLSGPTVYSIFEIVELIAKYYNYSMENVERISSLTLNQAAKRPPCTGFDISKARNVLGYSPKTIEETLDLF